jgi:hypothetical protein
MGLLDITLYVGIALMYNLLVHNLASISYKDLQYEDKQKNTIIMLILFGGLGILIAKLLNEKFTQYNNLYVSNGLFYGGILLILTALFASWDTIAQEMKFILIIAIFAGLIWYGYRREETQKETDGKINEEIITKLVDNNDNKTSNINKNQNENQKVI